MRLDEASRSSQRIDTLAALPADTAWRARRAGLFSAARLAMLRTAHSRWLLLVVAIGILVADILICTVPLYSTLVSDIQLQNTIATTDSLARNMELDVRTPIIDTSLSQRIDAVVRHAGSGYLGSFSKAQPTSYLTSGVVTLQKAGAHTFGSPGNIAEAHMQAFDFGAIHPYVRFVAGSSPKTTTTANTIQVMVTDEMANDWNLKVGQTVIVADLNNSTHRVTGVIAGIFEPINPNDPFWNGLSFAVDRGDNIPPVYPILTTSDSFYRSFSTFNEGGMIHSWIYYADPARITTSNMGAVAGDVVSFRTHVTGDVQSIPNVVNAVPQGSLDQIIQGVQKQLNLMALPLYVIAAQIVGLALLFVAAMAGLLIEYQGQEIATLKSRGTSGAQLLGIFTTQSTLLGVVAAIAGPVLASLLAVMLVRWFLPGAIAASSGVSAAYFSRVVTPSLVILPAIVGAVLGVAVVTFTTLAAARLDVLAFRREIARPSRKPFWRRAYLDIGLALLCLVGYLELGQFGGTQTRLDLGNQANSPLLLLTPALMLLSGGLLVLRVIPLAASLGARIASRGRGITSMLAFAQIERTPGRYSRMTLLLVLAVGLGLFALTFDASLQQNVHDRTAYAVGADMRLMTASLIPSQQSAAYLAHLKTLSGVEDATPLHRTYGSTPNALGNLGVDMLAVDSDSFAGVADARSWRSDFATQSLPDLMAQLKAHRAASSSRAVAQGPIWAIVSDTLAQPMHLAVGDRFQLGITDIPFASPTFVVGAIVHEFPTLYPNSAPGGFVVLDLQDLDGLIAANSDPGSPVGPNEFWLRTTNSASQHQTLLKQLDNQHFALSLNTVDSYREDLRLAQTNPTDNGMRGLLLIGAITAALLAVLGSLVQAVMSARQRTTQFAILRTLGMAGRQLTGLLLGEQTVVYLFGLLGGTALGLILTTATWPFLQFSDSGLDPAKIGVPSYLLRINWQQVGIFYGALLLAFVLALVITARYAATIGLGKALRLGED
ncbi:MAG TPA: FtsX-like permease family protein [Ktedonobacterales bacterium]|nr:FtsX-like permease family protein [Ktedonobacterales bacterium]